MGISYRYRGNKKSSGLGILISGIFMIVVAIKMFSFMGEMKALEERCTQSTTGVVTNVEAQRRTGGRRGRRRTYYVYSTKFIYTANNVDVEAMTTFSESEKVDVGNEVIVHYNPDIPTEFYTGESNADSVPKGVLAGTLVLGIIFVLAGFRIAVKR